MKKIEYICDKCGKTIDKEGLYSICPCRLDPERDGLTAGIPDEVSDELFEQLDDKHLCLSCLKKTLKFFNGPAVINQGFEKEVPKFKPKTEQKSEHKTKSVITEEQLRDMIENQGMTARQVAESANLDISGIYQKIQKFGIQLPSKRKVVENTSIEEKTAPEQQAHTEPMSVELVKEAYFSGKTIPEVAKHFGVSLQEMRNFLIRNRISKSDKEYLSYLQKCERVEDLGV